MTITVLYRDDAPIGLLVPFEMRELYGCRRRERRRGLRKEGGLAADSPEPD